MKLENIKAGMAVVFNKKAHANKHVRSDRSIHQVEKMNDPYCWVTLEDGKQVDVHWLKPAIITSQKNGFKVGDYVKFSDKAKEQPILYADNKERKVIKILQRPNHHAREDSLMIEGLIGPYSEGWFEDSVLVVECDIKAKILYEWFSEQKEKEEKSC